jgi:DNA modification methylase
MIKFLQGSCIDKIKELDDNTIDCVVTSPPYWGLRDYGTAKWQGGDPNCSHSYGRNTRGGLTQFQKNNKGSFGDEAIKSGECCKLCGAKRIDKQLGLEPTYQEHIQNIVELFRAIKPKLKDSATVWLNYGDSYASTVNGTKVKDQVKNKVQFSGKYLIKGDDRTFRDKPFSTIQGSLKPKDLVMIPNRIAIALQDDGWWIRSEIIWHKPNPMPESTKDRPTSCHEKIWLITKSKKYYYDADAIREPVAQGTITRLSEKNLKNQKGSNRGNGGMRSNGNMKPVGNMETKNKRNVWTVTTKPCKEAHFATFPKDLIEPCIKAGCPEKVCVKCGTPYVRNLKIIFTPERKTRDNMVNVIPGRDKPTRMNSKNMESLIKKDLGFKKDCNCKTDEFKSGVVLDPFGGSGTTGIVSALNNRNAILIELNPEYIKIAEDRINKEFGFFNT